MSVPTLIFVTGLPATGKTTIGKGVSEQLQIPFISKDVFKETLFETMGWSGREWSKKIGTAARQLVDYVVEEELRAERSIVLESNFKPELDSERFQALQQQYGYIAVQVLCSAEGGALFERFMARADTGERHPGHADIASAEEWRQVFMTQRSEALAIKGLVIPVDTTDFSKVDNQAIAEQVRTAISLQTGVS